MGIGHALRFILYFYILLKYLYENSASTSATCQHVIFQAILTYESILKLNSV